MYTTELDGFDMTLDTMAMKLTLFRSINVIHLTSMSCYS